MRYLLTSPRQLGRIPFIFVLLMIAGFFWLFGDSIFPVWDVGGISFSTAISYYIVLLVVFLIFSMFRAPRQIATPTNLAVKQFAIGFLITLIIMLIGVGAGVVGQSSINPLLIVPMIIMQVAIVAPAEELMFRGVLLSYVGIVLQAILFSLWHIVTYGAVWTAFGWPEWIPIVALMQSFVFGLILGFVAVRSDLGIPACIGAHACFNLVVLGVIVL